MELSSKRVVERVKKNERNRLMRLSCSCKPFESGDEWENNTKHVDDYDSAAEN